MDSGLNLAWENDWVKRGRGKPWFSAWYAAGEEETDHFSDGQRKPANLSIVSDKSPRNVIGYLKDRRPYPSAEEDETDAIRASHSFRKDLASLDAGLIHNPANGSLDIIGEIDPEPSPTTNNEPDVTDDSHPPNTPELDLSEEELTFGSVFKKYRQAIQDLFFPPWRPYTNINLDLDPYDHDLENPDTDQAETTWVEEEQVIAVPEAKLENKTIHILGLGAVGKYVAHTLASLTDGPPVTLLMHRPLVMQSWHDEGAAIRLVKGGQLHVQSGFNIESAASFRRETPDQVFPHFGTNLEHSAEPPDTVIDTLIVATDSWLTLPALEAIKHRLRSQSTICFLQNGLGIVEKVSATIFTDSDRQPTYVLGNISHQVKPTDRSFTISLEKLGTLVCSKLPKHTVYDSGDVRIQRNNFSWSPQSKHLVGSLSRAFDFHTKTLGHKSFYNYQLQKLVIRSIIGPLSVMYDCSADKLLYNYNAHVMMVELLKEISHVIRLLPELRNIRHVEKIFHYKKLEYMCVSAIAQQGAVESAMLQSVRAGRRTNIEYYNGYIQQRAVQMGIPCPRNDFVLRLVRGKQAARSKEITGYIPMITGS